jgi:hypothetical protein
MSDIVIVKMCHVRKVSHCSRGARDFFNNHNLSWQDFLENGISSDILELTGDFMAMQVVQVAKTEESKDG